MILRRIIAVFTLISAFCTLKVFGAEDMRAGAPEARGTQQEAQASAAPPPEEEKRIKVAFGGSIDSRMYFTHQAIDKKGTMGSFNEIRLHADIRYSTQFRVFIEPMFKGYYGSRNNTVMLGRYGLLTADQRNLASDMGALGYDDSEQIMLNRGWAELSFKRFSFRVGKQVIAWARAYSFNPTDKINTPNILDPLALNTGVMGVSYEARIFENVDSDTSFSFLGYFVTTNKDFKNNPFAVKAKLSLSSFEVALSYIYEVKDDETYINKKVRKSHAGLDFFFQIKDISFYFEGTYRFEKNRDRDFGKQIITVAGISTTFSFKMSLRIEYIHYGPGTRNKQEYNVYPLLSQLKPFMAKNYLFIMIDRDLSSYVWLGFSTYINLDDKSFILIPQLRFSIIENVKLEVGAYIFLGSKGSEYYGRFNIVDSATYAQKQIDIAETQGYAKLKISF